MARDESIVRSPKDDLNNNLYWGKLLNSKFPNGLDFTKFQCYGVVKGSKPLVAWAFHSYLNRRNSNLIEYEASVSIASFTKVWHPLRTIRLILSLFFKDSCYNRLTAVTLESNRQAVRLLKIAGFTQEGYIRRPAQEENKLQFSILREDWEAGRFYG